MKEIPNIRIPMPLLHEKTPCGTSACLAGEIIPRFTPERLRAICIMLIGFSLCVGCSSNAEKPVPPPPGVTVAPVIQKDVPIYREWVGTTVGSVDADIRPKVEGYFLLRALDAHIEIARKSAVERRPERPAASRSPYD